AREWRGFELVLLSPKGDPGLGTSSLVLASVSEREPVLRKEFPLEKSEIDAIKHGRRGRAVVPVSPEESLAVGDRIRFLEAASDPFGFPVLVPMATPSRST